MRFPRVPFATRVWLVLLVVSYLVFSYNYFGYWWNAACGTALILLFGRQIWGRKALSVAGFDIGRSTLLRSAVLTLLVIAMSWQLMSIIAAKEGVGLDAPSWKSALHISFYVLNEEIVLGAILLYFMISEWDVKPIRAAIFLALFFSIIHFVFYRWVFDERGIIQVSTLLSLFMVGFFRNTLILVSGHIAYSWAFHFGWILIMLGGDHRGGTQGASLAEHTRFNLYLGSWPMVTISLVLAAGGLTLLLRKGVPEEQT